MTQHLSQNPTPFSTNTNVKALKPRKPLVRLTQDKTLISEGETLTRTFTLSEPVPEGGITLNLVFVSGTDALPEDTQFLADASTGITNFKANIVDGRVVGFEITLAEGVTEAQAVFDIVNDGIAESSEVEVLALAKGKGYKIDHKAGAVSLTIEDTGELVPIQNAGFEDPFLDDFTFSTTPPPGWDLYNPDNLVPAETTDETSSTGAFNPSIENYPNGVPEGDNVACVFLVDELGSGQVGVSQALDTLLAANTRYTLSVEVGNPTGNDPVPGINFAGFPGYRVELLAGNTVLASDQNNLFIEEGTFETSKVTFTTTSDTPYLGQNLGIRLINILQGPGIEVDFDDVQLTAKPI